MTNYILIAVDVQFDFLPGGALGVPNGDQVLLPLHQLAERADLFVVSRDWHPENHFSFSEDPAYADGSWPPHCIQGTKGAKIHRSILKMSPEYTISKGMNRNPPDTYSAFAGKTLRPVTSLEEILAQHSFSTVIVGGLALDYCVKHTALDAAALGYHAIVPLDATRGVSEDTSKDAIKRLERAGVEIVEHYGN